jgi:hypothetical protein
MGCLGRGVPHLKSAGGSRVVQRIFCTPPLSADIMRMADPQRKGDDMSDEDKQEPVSHDSEAPAQNDAAQMAGADQLPELTQPNRQSAAPRRPLFRN